MNEQITFGNIHWSGSTAVIILEEGTGRTVIGRVTEMLGAMARSAGDEGIPHLICAVRHGEPLSSSTTARDDVLAAVPVIEVDERNPFAAQDFRRRVEQLDRSRLVLAGTAIEGAVSLVALSALEEGYDVHLLVDGIPDPMSFSDQIALYRLMLAGAVPITGRQLTMELKSQARIGA